MAGQPDMKHSTVWESTISQKELCHPLGRTQSPRFKSSRTLQINTYGNYLLKNPLRNQRSPVQNSKAPTPCRSPGGKLQRTQCWWDQEQWALSPVRGARLSIRQDCRTSLLLVLRLTLGLLDRLLGLRTTRNFNRGLLMHFGSIRRDEFSRQRQLLSCRLLRRHSHFLELAVNKLGDFLLRHGGLRLRTQVPVRRKSTVRALRQSQFEAANRLVRHTLERARGDPRLRDERVPDKLDRHSVALEHHDQIRERFPTVRDEVRRPFKRNRQDRRDDLRMTDDARSRAVCRICLEHSRRTGFL